MKKYFLTKTTQENNEYILHSASCSELPPEEELIYLGFFRTFPIAFEQTKKLYADVAEKIIPCEACSTILIEH